MGGAAALTALGVMAAFASIVVIDPLFGTVEAEWTLLGELLNNYIVQPGFGLVAACYIWWRDDYNPLERIQVPSFEGVAWIGLGVIGYELAVRAVTPILPLIGLSHSAHGDTTAKWRVFFDHPEIIVPGLVVMFVIMAPMEEALYRGVVHDVLEPALGSLGRVLVGGFLFGGMHLFFSGGLGSLLLTSIFGVLLAAGYERTNNLVVPIMAHAGYWLIFTSF
ncbi:CPBP family intramembrane glutamic endopeptidase [Halorubrum ezzemoulense]|uniref:CPBP family intramembrane glutamic endopeptidase n=1 Tax=Halorubrum ezzemoulense TaxID=337243 RepID=UPI00211B14A2|nr:CPBP family intramembrane glutamic endopeptidase [Halorubrum ezzemoulense]